MFISFPTGILECSFPAVSRFDPPSTNGTRSASLPFTKHQTRKKILLPTNLPKISKSWVLLVRTVEIGATMRTNTRRHTLFLLFGFLSSRSAESGNSDRFNYRETVGNDFGPADWDQVTCDDVGGCLGWPDGWELGVGWELTDNLCEWCPADGGNNCGLHWQSPIDLLRSEATTGHDTECHDYHWMAYQDGSCQWHDIIKNGYSTHENNFHIERHSLQILQPIDDEGNLQCQSAEGSQFPRLDYSKGFPDWWFLSHTEITVPSEHTQEGKRYDAEVHLAHFYSEDFERKMGKVAIFLEADPGRERWDFLDKLICQWREVEEKTRDECGLESVPPYPGCRNPNRTVAETNLPYVDPFPFIDCDSVHNAFRMCKENSCCEAERSQSEYCQDKVYGLYGDDVMASVCWWCCPGKILGPPETNSPTSTPSPTSTNSPTTDAPSESPTTVAPSDYPSGNPTGNPTEGPTTNGIPYQSWMAEPVEPVVCADYVGHKDINMNRICKDGGCCDPIRSAGSDCHFAYKFFGHSMASVCSDCCEPSKQLAPAPPQHYRHPPIDCTTIDNPHRICKPNSCCEDEKSDSRYCEEEVYKPYGDMMGSVCWYCCSEPKEVDPAVLSVEYNAISTPSMAPFSNVVTPVDYKEGLDTPQPVAPTEPPSITPSESPSSAPTDSPVSARTSDVTPYSIPVPDRIVVCSDYDGHPDINMKRICKDGGCCDPLRSARDDCHFAYNFFGDIMASVCADCCEPSKQLAPPPPRHETYPPVDCSMVDNPYRMCKPNSCCEGEMSDSNYCEDVYEAYGIFMGSVCWYCCSEPKEVDPDVLTMSRKLSSTNDENHSDMAVMKPSTHQKAPRHDILLPHGMWASEVAMDPDNFQVTANLEEEYLKGIEDYRIREEKARKEKQANTNNARRTLTEGDDVTGDNYINVPYSPYEWMREAKTEYYYRYEGGQMVPPCFEIVHYRVLKDPIRIHPDQLAELERLLAERIAPLGSENNACQRDTAGRERPGTNGTKVDLNRPLQSYSNIHRKVFCECKDWDSKWDEDIAWCELDEDVRYYDHPYNFDWNVTGGGGF